LSPIRLGLIVLPFVAGIAIGLVATPGAAVSLPFMVTATPSVTPTATSTPTPTLTPTPVFTETPTLTPTATATATVTVTMTPTATPTVEKRGSVLDEGTMLTIYGRAFGIAPVLGLLGQYKSFDDMDKDIQKRFAGPVKANNGGKPIIPTVHLIYALAMPCPPDDDCLLYLEGAKIDIVKEYIEPAQKRGWEVILDTQMGRSDPVTQVKRIIDKGYLKYENVHIALDPEFHVYPGKDLPGQPIGQLEAAQINDAQKLMDDYIRANGLKRKRMLMVHQFGDPEVNDGVPFMITNKKNLKTYPAVDIVLDADGVGGSEAKVNKYNKMLNAKAYPFIQYRAFKIFIENPLAGAHHSDRPQMKWEWIFGKEATPFGAKMEYPPNVVIVA
jgi:hypothetical protein